jgi:amidase
MSRYCGIYGLKPTHGLIPYTGIMSLHPMIDHTGPLATSLEDVCTLLSVLAGYDGIDPRMTPESPLRSNVKDYAGLLSSWVDSKKSQNEWTPTSAGKGLRIGLIKESLEVFNMTTAVKESIIKALDRYRSMGATVSEVSIPIHLIGPSIWTMATREDIGNFGFQNNPQPLLNYPIPGVVPPPFDQNAFDILSKYNPAVVNVVLGGSYLSTSKPSALAKAMMHVHELRAAYDAALADFDVLITPVNPTVGSKHPTHEMSVGEKMAPSIGGTLNTCPFNVSGHPALAMPIGFADVEGGEGKLPLSMQIIGRRFDEESVLRVAKAWEVGGLGIDAWDGK